MKKFLTLFLALILSAGTMFAVNIGGLYYSLDDSKKEAYVVYKNKYTNNYPGLKKADIPSTVTYVGTTYKVTAIAQYAFYGCTELTSVTIPNTVTLIGDYAFHSCSGLTSITLPNSVTKVGRAAFYGCTGLTTAVFNDHVFAYLPPTYSGKWSIKSGITFIAGNAFSHCTGLTSVYIPNSVELIGGYAFNGCTGLTSVFIPLNVKDMGEEVFLDCSNLTTVTLNADSIANKSNLKSIFGSQVTEFIIGSDVKTIGNSAFSGYTNLSKLTIGTGVTSISSSAFSKNVPAQCIVIKSNALLNNAYTESNSLKNIFGENVPHYTIGEGVTNIGDNAFYGCSGMTDLTIENSVTGIGSCAFAACAGLTEITIPQNIASIGNAAFRDCTGLTSIIWNAKNCADFEYKQNPFYYYYYKPTLVYEQYLGDIRSQIRSITFGTDVDTIPAYLCAEMDSITSFSMPTNVKCIHASAFRNCKSLATVTIGNGVTEIGNNAFSDCPVLTSVKIGRNVTKIDDWAFYKCSSLSSLELGKNVESIGGCAFHSCASLKSIDIPNSVKTIGGSAFNECTSLTSVKTGNGIEHIGSKAFEKCSSLTSVVVSSGIIYDYAFRECPSITSVTIGSGVTAIKKGAFYNTSSMGNVRIVCTGVQPAKIEADAFKCFDSNMIRAFGRVYVPCGSENAYKQAWKDYSISPIEDCRLPYYTVTFVDGDGVILKTELVEEGQSATAPDYKSWDSHTFCSWDKDFSRVYSNMTVQARYILSPEAIMVRLDPLMAWFEVYLYAWTDDGKELLGKWPGTLVEKDEDGWWAYLFPEDVSSVNIIWNGDGEQTIDLHVTQRTCYELPYSCPDYSKITPSVVSCPPTTEMCPTQHTITFVNWDDSILYRTQLDENEMPRYVGPEPTRPSSVDSTYSFSGWTPEIAAVTEDAIYTATYQSSLRQYTVTFLNDNGDTLSTKQWNYGATPTCNEPTKTATAQYTYTFAGWTPEIVAVTEDATYTATYTATINQYTIRFVNWDGKELQSSKVEYGQLPVYSGATPTRPDSEQYTYTFDGWSPKIVEVTADATYTAKYTSEVRKYTVTFLDEDGSVLCEDEWIYGLFPYCEEPIKADDDEYSYTFAGWMPEVVAVTQSTTYTATYSAEPINQEGLENIMNNSMPHKIIVDGQIYILRGDKTYTVTGQVK